MILSSACQVDTRGESRIPVSERERERQVYLQLDELDSNIYNIYHINIIQYNTYNIVDIQVGYYLLCLLPIVQSPWY